ncbi:lecithin retinol acyltransferase family protein [Sessilibacter corallicola]|uniref:lecithin retinol acyltransferase family protein n=1 Tax=Sessilibacter corallicola TaxID=2904075 RepID=UPI001E522ABF|nr:lecithin retinol acyltransferase family protein [Sessilibacter corallicola]MCE2027579.1 lecithin retinol acyltransferase family protein [Sessilibacter corallicola]
MQVNTNSTLLPGDIIKVDCGSYYHYAIVSDAIGGDGMFLLIDLSRATGTVSERAWSVVVGLRCWSVSRIRSLFSPEEIIQRARKWINYSDYSILGNNCECFVRHVAEDKPNSRQVTAGLSCGTAASIVAYKASDGNVLITGLLGLGFGLLAAKAFAE